MWRFIASLVLVGFAASGAVADGPAVVRRDTQFPVELHHTLDARTAKPGDPVEFRTEEAVLIGNNVVVPAKAKIFGTVTEVRRQSPGSPSILRIRIHTLQWKNRQAPLNAMIQSVSKLRAESSRWSFRHAPTFLEGIRVVSHIRREAYTEFTCDKKDVKVRSGLSFLLRQVDPSSSTEREFVIYSPEDDQSAGGW